MIKAILKKARRLLVTRGWCKGDYRKGNRFCAVGAINYAACGDAEDDWSSAGGGDAQIHFCDVNKLGGIANWNDSPERTKKEVLNALDKAIKAAKK